jgi:Fe2+ transport system protein B
VDLYADVVADGTNFPNAGGTAQTKGLFLTKYAAGATESAFTANGSYAPPSSTLQSAYNVGASITTASSTAVEFILTSGGFNVEGSEAVIFGGSTAISSFEVTTSTAVTITAAADREAVSAQLGSIAAAAQNHLPVLMLGSVRHSLAIGSKHSMLASVVAASDSPPTTYTFPSMHTAAQPCLATLMSGKARHCPADVSYISALFKAEPPS